MSQQVVSLASRLVPLPGKIKCSERVPRSWLLPRWTGHVELNRGLPLMRRLTGAYAPPCPGGAKQGALVLGPCCTGGSHRPSTKSLTACGWDRNGWWPASISTTVPALRANSR